MERLTTDLFSKFQLSRPQAAIVACASKSLNAIVMSVWCRYGISLRQSLVNSVLGQDCGKRWTDLQRLCLWSQIYPKDCLLGWEDFEYPLPNLRDLVLLRVEHPVRPWEVVLQNLPALTSLDITTRIGARSSRTISALRDVVAAAAPRLVALRLHCEGIVVYPQPSESSLHGLCEAVRTSLWGAPMVQSDTLETYTNRGKQACYLGVDAPLRCLELDEADGGPCALYRIGPRCNETLRTLDIAASPSRLPKGVRQRFRYVQEFRVRFERIVSQQRVTDVWKWIHDEIPTKTKTLVLDFDFWWFLPDAWTSWERSMLESLPELESVTFTCSHAALGTAELLGTVLGACNTLRKVRFQTRWCAVASVFGELSCTDVERDEMSDDDIYTLRREIDKIHRVTLDILRERPLLDVSVNIATED